MASIKAIIAVFNNFSQLALKERRGRINALRLSVDPVAQAQVSFDLELENNEYPEFFIERRRNQTRIESLRFSYTCPRCFLEFGSRSEYFDHLSDNYNGLPMQPSETQLKFYARESELTDAEKRAFEYTGGRTQPTRPLESSSIAQELKGIQARKKKNANGSITGGIIGILLMDI
jgi:hypothetical protein